MIQNSNSQKILMDFVNNREYPEQYSSEYSMVLTQLIENKIDDLSTILDLHTVTPGGHVEFPAVEKHIQPGIDAIDFISETSEPSYEDIATILLTEIILATTNFDYNPVSIIDETLDPEIEHICTFHRCCAQISAEHLCDTLGSDAVKLQIGYKYAKEY